jgi:hypothetical protein
VSDHAGEIFATKTSEAPELVRVSPKIFTPVPEKNPVTSKFQELSKVLPLT